jgi:hypothetical protein
MQLKKFSFICPVIESAAVLKAIETVISQQGDRSNSWQYR